jgi:hypothetical protein
MVGAARLETLCAFALTLAALCGCQVHRGGRIYVDTAWEQNGGTCGKVLLLVCSQPPMEASEDRSANIAEVSKIASDVLSGLPRTTVLQQPATDPSSSSLSDAQAAALGRTMEADSVCLISLANYGTMYAIGLNPFPESRGEARALYALRLIDARSGHLLATAVTDYSAGGPFARSHDDLKHGLEHSLRSDLTVRHAPSLSDGVPLPVNE